ncbi:hypothetical protein [Legionella longbeachae]|uniref:hypothetical protein n=1 Tax=Legionella longbeachae TaxID=450 RepID=UPI00124432BA|nr:hypothetical protein [Legionella longbeachae]QEY53135.1 hypothetical protein FQU71_18950 [Legionella longbeachae]
MPIEDIIHHKNLHKPTEPPPLGSPIIQDINPQELILEAKSKESFLRKHKKAIIAVSASVLAAAVLGVAAFFAWPAVASAILGFGVFGLTLGALAGANLVAQVGLVAAVFAVGGFIASGGLFTAGSKAINSIRKAWNSLYASPVGTQAIFITQPDPIMSIAKPLPLNGGISKNNAPLSSVTPAIAPVATQTSSVTFFTQMQQKKDKCMRLVEINNQLLNGALSKIEKRQLKTEIAILEKDILPNRQNKLDQNKQKEEQSISNFKDEYRSIRSCDDTSIQTPTAFSNITKVTP